MDHRPDVWVLSLIALFSLLSPPFSGVIFTAFPDWARLALRPYSGVDLTSPLSLSLSHSSSLPPRRLFSAILFFSLFRSF